MSREVGASNFGSSPTSVALHSSMSRVPMRWTVTLAFCWARLSGCYVSCVNTSPLSVKNGGRTNRRRKGNQRDRTVTTLNSGSGVNMVAKARASSLSDFSASWLTPGGGRQ
jgi:hypothetical protein